MKKLLFLLRKEFRQIRRNRFMIRAIIAVPILQMLIFVPAITFEIKRIDLAVIDNDRSQASRELVSKLTGSSFFVVTATPATVTEAESMLLSGDADIALVIPPDFSRGLAGVTTPRLQVLADAVNASTAQLSWSYITSVIRDFNREVIISTGMIPANMAAIRTGSLPGISVSPRYWYNPKLNYKYYMLPGMLVILITVIGLMMIGFNLVREKESGTIEQINVTPIMKWQLIVSRIILFFIIGLFDLALGLGIGWLAFNIPFEGSLLLFFACAAIFLVAVLGLALFFSTMASTQQQFLFIAFFFVMVFILMSGIFTPTESMPLWAQQFNLVNPVAYLMRINRMVMLKGSGFSEIMRDMAMLTILALSYLSLAIRAYRKRA
ncbi:MAG TPA: ABC transporter permease [Bacteroidales bacterium]|jgi:ABC-2 type transport system permease protein|nr:ABC transporter permease [Bacteroidales bacterium]HNY58058.1 ABC transporter permease [Bacteroidales bacterium]HOH14212.1 ABC transporter permease [Bacteroidales bacterium]HPX53642.1 ABC transporter permease [Bacteroidales bacterium]HQB51824.1 ABC transporter permease [Bacteroidales bacterium]